MVTILVRVAIGIYEVPSLALASELTGSYDQRTSIMSYRAFMGWCGGMMAALLAYVVFLKADEEHPVGQLNPAGYGNMGLAFGLLMMVVILISAAGTHRHIPYLRKPIFRQRLHLSQVVSEMSETLANRSLLMLLCSGIFSSLAIGLGSALNIYILTYFWNLSTEQIGGMMAALFLGAALAFVLAPRLSRHLTKRRAAVFAGIGYMFFNLSPVALRLFDLFPPNGSPMIVPILSVTYALAIAALVSFGILIGSMLADVVEDSEVKTGRRSDGVIFSANLFIQKCVSGIGVFGAGLVLSAVSFPENVKPETLEDGVMRNLAIIFVLAQAIFYIIAMMLVRGYRITREAHETNLDTLAQRAAAVDAHLLAEDAVEQGADIKRADGLLLDIRNP